MVEDIASKLRDIANVMSESPKLAHTADALKLQLRKLHGANAAKIIEPAWPKLNSGGLRYVADWMIVLRALRYTLDGATHEKDFDAFKIETEPVYGESNDPTNTEPIDWRETLVSESDMTEGERLEFYWDQSRLWADLLNRFADLLDDATCTNPTIKTIVENLSFANQQLLKAMLTFSVGRRVTYQELLAVPDNGLMNGIELESISTRLKEKEFRRKLSREHFDFVVHEKYFAFTWKKKPIS